MLAHTRVAAGGAAPRSWLVVLHGIFGAGRNWTTVARGLADARRDWGALLVDLRMHGASQGFPPPHTLESCAADLAVLKDALGLPVTAVLGHSFGGKVALAYLARRPAGLRQVWVVDADPSAAEPDGGAWDLLRAVRALPPVFPARADLVAGLARFGFDRRTAEWMATNLAPAADGYRWRLDFDAIEALLRDFFRRDLWTVVEDAPPVDLRFLKAAESDVMSGAAVARLEAIGASTGRVEVDRVRGGHWLNADNPGALATLLVSRLP